MLEVYLNLHRLSDPNCFRGWLRRIALNHAADKLRRQSLVRPSHIASIPGQLTDADADRRSAVQLAMNTLKPLLRETLELHYLQNCPLKEISVRLGVPLGTVKRRLHAARERLRTVGGTVERKC